MKKTLIHAFLILMFLSIPIFSSPDFDGSFKMLSVPMFQKSFIEMILLIIFFYLNFFVLMPRLFNTKKYLVYGISITLFYFLVALTPSFLVNNKYSRIIPPKKNLNKPNLRNEINLHNPPPKLPSNNLQHPLENEDSILFTLARAILPFGFSLLSSSYLFINNKKREIEMQKNKAELLSLKYQLQPHFLFNILNNIYSMAILKSDETPDSILKLSNVMRYVVDKSSKDLVSLGEEIAYLVDYISLQLVRTDESLDFNFYKKIENQQLQIAPMILVNFVENAFKYGFNPEEQSKIEVSITTHENILHFIVKNNIVNRNISTAHSTKIGIKNTLERLQEIYPSNHTISISNSDDKYVVDLEIHLTENIV